MLFPILQALWQQFGPQVLQAVQQASPYIVSTMRQIPVPVYRQALWSLSESASNWYQSLSEEDIKKLQRAVAWVVKDMAGDMVATVTGLPISPVVNLAVEKVLDELGHGENASPAEVTFIKSELLQQLSKS